MTTCLNEPQRTADNSTVPTYHPDTVSAEPETTIRAPHRSQGSDLIVGFQSEIDQYYMQMIEFNEIDVRGTMAALAAISSRVSFMRSQIIRSEGRLAKSFRTGQIEPLLEEVDRQFKTWSRYQSVAQMEFDASRGGV